MTLNECVELANTIAERSRHGNALDPGDRRSVATCAAWEALTTLPNGRPVDLWLGMVVRSRLIDEIRRQKGRRHQHVHEYLLDELHPTAVALPDEIELADLIQHIAHGNRQVAEVLHRIAAGGRKTEVAQHMGVHKSRISQILRTVRTSATAGLLTDTPTSAAVPTSLAPTPVVPAPNPSRLPRRRTSSDRSVATRSRSGGGAG